MSFLLAALTCMLLSTTARCRLPEYQLSRLAEQDGLATAEVVGLAMDQQTYLWIATQARVQRFDGRRTLSFSFDETIYQLWIDGKDRVWVITSSGAYHLSDRSAGFRKLPLNMQPGETPLRIFERPGGVMLLIGSRQRYRFDEEMQQFSGYDESPFQAESRLLRLFSSGKQAEYYATPAGIIRQDHFSDHTSFFPMTSLHTLQATGRGGIIVSTYLYRSYWLEEATGKFHPIRYKAGNQHRDLLIHHAVSFDSARYLLSTNAGLLLFDPERQSLSEPVFYFKGEPIPNPAASRLLYRGSDGTIYICHADGIFFFHPGRQAIQYIRNYRYGNERLSDNEVRSFSEDDQGGIWMATTAGIARLEPKSGRLQTFSSAASANPIDFPSYRYVLSHGDMLWIGTSGNGIWMMHKPTGQFMRPGFATDSAGEMARKAMQDAYVWKILPMRDGRFLAVCSRNSFLIDPISRTCRLAVFASSGESSRSAWQDSLGRIWHGTASGLTCMTEGFEPLFRIRDSFPDKRIAALYEWKSGRMLIGTKGLYEAVTDAANRLISFTCSSAIPPERFIYCMTADRSGMIWMGTDDGLYRYDPAKQLAIRFDASDHVQSQAFSSNGAFMSRTGMLYMGGHNGVNYFDPDRIEPQSQLFFPVVSQFSVQGEDRPLSRDTSGPVEIDYHQRGIAFTISAPNYKNPYTMRYRYRLSNKPDAWIDNGFQETVRIDRLSPGSYQLEVAVSTDGIEWSVGKDALDFTVLKPWWRTNSFRAMLAGLMLISAAGFRRYRIRRREARELKKAVSHFALHDPPQASTDSILWDIARNCISRLGFEDCVIYLVDEEPQVLVQKAAFGNKYAGAYQVANPIEIAVGEGITGDAARLGISQLVKDTSRDTRYIVDDERRYSELAVPILHDGRVIGVIDSEHRRKGFFTAQHQQTVEQIAAICSARIARGLAVEKAQQAEEKVRMLHARMMEERFMNLRLQMNPHFLFNTLTSIQYLIVSGQVEKATRYLNVFSTFLRSVLQFAEVNAVTLQEELRILRLYIELESLSLDETFEYEIVCEDDLDPEEVTVPFMILQPFVENAIQHGLIHRIGQKRFMISLGYRDNGLLTCIIEDNGVGRKRSAAINEARLRNNMHESRGIAIVRQRLALLSERYGRNGSVAFEDLYDANGTATGTRVRMVVPTDLNTML